jgi:hypothetical protein
MDPQPKIQILERLDLKQTRPEQDLRNLMRNQASEGLAVAPKIALGELLGDR